MQSTDTSLLSPLSIRGLTLRNRIVVSPMCQYSSEDGFANDWHLVHLGSRAVGGAGLIFTEAAAVTPQGRISPKDLGLWEDSQCEQLKRITTFLKQMGAKAGIQLAHAGRKGSCSTPWEGGARLTAAQGGWDVVAPSPTPFLETSPDSIELTIPAIYALVDAFATAVQRALKAGFEVIEIHAAHGYLIHEFLSPLTNKRQDEFGGSLENRLRLLCLIIEKVRLIMPVDMPLFVRISATDWLEEGWGIEESVVLAKTIAPLGVDLIDTSSGAIAPHINIPVGPGYQAPLAAEIRSRAQIMTGAVGMITEVQQANELIKKGAADLIFLAREFLREPYWALKAAETLNQLPSWPIPYGYAVKKQY